MITKPIMSNVFKSHAAKQDSAIPITITMIAANRAIKNFLIYSLLAVPHNPYSYYSNTLL